MLSSGLKDLSKEELLDLVEQLVGEVALLRERVCALESENAALKEEVARLKGLKGRPKLKPSGMEEATNGPKGKGKGKKRKRAARRSPVVNEEHKLSVAAPAGSRFKGYDDFVVQDLRLDGRVIRYRRERWLTPECELLVAPLPAGLRGHFGPELVCFILLQHHQGQMTTDRMALLLNSLGLSISKRQVLRLPSDNVDAFCDEAHAVLRAGLESADWITVDDTGARHRNRNGVLDRMDDLLRVLDRPEIPLDTNRSENDIRCHVIKQKISGGTRSEAGLDAGDTFLGLLKTCQKLGVSFYADLGHRFDVKGAPIDPPLPELILAAEFQRELSGWALILLCHKLL